jgi:integrase
MTKSEAKTWATKWRAEVLATPATTGPVAAAPVRTLRDAVGEYVTGFVKVPTRRPLAGAEMQRLIEAWLTMTDADGATLADRPLDSITAADITRLVDARHARAEVRGEKAGRVGTNRLLSRLRHFFGEALRRGWITASPFADQPGRPAVAFVRGVEGPRTRRLREGEEDALLKAANPHTKALITAGLDTCCRVGELLALTFDDVDVDHDVIRVRAETAKTNEARTVPMTARVKAIITMRRTAPDGTDHPGTAFVFGNAVGERILEHKTAWLACCRRAKVDGLHFHDLRREGASRLHEAGVPLNVVSAWLGHSNAAQTAIYLRINTPQLQDARAKLEAAQKAAEDAAKAKAAAAKAKAEAEAAARAAVTSPDDTACHPLANSADPAIAADSALPVSTAVH